MIKPQICQTAAFVYFVLRMNFIFQQSPCSPSCNYIEIGFDFLCFWVPLCPFCSSIEFSVMAFEALQSKMACLRTFSGSHQVLHNPCRQLIVQKELTVRFVALSNVGTRCHAWVDKPHEPMHGRRRSMFAVSGSKSDRAVVTSHSSAALSVPALNNRRGSNRSAHRRQGTSRPSGLGRLCADL